MSGLCSANETTKAFVKVMNIRQNSFKKVAAFTLGYTVARKGIQVVVKITKKTLSITLRGKYVPQ